MVKAKVHSNGTVCVICLCFVFVCLLLKIVHFLAN